MYIPNVLTKASISTRPIKRGGGDGEDARGPLLSLTSKLVHTMQPPPKKSQDVDINTPPLKPSPKLVLNLHVKGFPSSSSSMQQQQKATTTTRNANRSRNEVPTNSKLKLDNNILLLLLELL